MRYCLLQEWDGTVTEIGDDEFTAELRDLTDPTNCREEATFEFSAVPPPDRALLTLGAVFRWRVGYENSATGQRRRAFPGCASSAHQRGTSRPFRQSSAERPVAGAASLDQ